MRRRTFQNLERALEAVRAADNLGMGYTLTKGVRVYPPAGPIKKPQSSAYYWLDLDDVPVQAYPEPEGQSV